MESQTGRHDAGLIHFRKGEDQMHLAIGADGDGIAHRLQEGLAAVRIGIACRIIPRKEASGKAISASTVRVALQSGDWELLKTLVPPTTLDYFTSPEAAPILERIRRAGNVVHY